MNDNDFNKNANPNKDLPAISAMYYDAEDAQRDAESELGMRIVIVKEDSGALREIEYTSCELDLTATDESSYASGHVWCGPVSEISYQGPRNECHPWLLNAARQNVALVSPDNAQNLVNTSVQCPG